MQILTKFNIGDKVWYMWNNKCINFIIIGIKTFMGKYDYEDKNSNIVEYNLYKDKHSSHRNVKEKELFSTKEELISTL